MSQSDIIAKTSAEQLTQEIFAHLSDASTQPSAKVIDEMRVAVTGILTLAEVVPFHKIQGRVFRSVTIKGSKFLERIGDDGSRHLDLIVDNHLDRYVSAQLDCATIRPFPTAEVGDFYGQFVCGLDMDLLRFSGPAQWWVCRQEGDAYLEHIPLIGFAAADIQALADAFNLPIVEQASPVHHGNGSAQ